jgi:hypothetical protein
MVVPEMFSIRLRRDLNVLPETMQRNFVHFRLRQNVTVPKASGFLRCRSEKTTTCTGRHRSHFFS